VCYHGGAEQRWLIHDLSADGAVGIVGGKRKVGKSFLGLDMVVAVAAGVTLADLPIHVITAPSLRLYLAADRQQLHARVAAWQPILLVPDPFVRLHRFLIRFLLTI